MRHSSSQEDLKTNGDRHGPETGDGDGGEAFQSLPPMHLEQVAVDESRGDRTSSKGPRALRRRHGKKMDRSKVVRRKSSINGHWYDRDTSVFTPPKGSCMSTFVTSLSPTQEVVKMMLEKYRVETEPAQFALYVVKESGERRLVGDAEFPLLLRVRLGPREDIAKLFLLDKNRTKEINHEVAQYLK